MMSSKVNIVELPADFVLAEKIQDGGMGPSDIWIVLRKYSQTPYRFVVNGWVSKEKRTFDCHYFENYEDAEKDFSERAYS